MEWGGDSSGIVGDGWGFGVWIEFFPFLGAGDLGGN